MALDSQNRYMPVFKGIIGAAFVLCVTLAIPAPAQAQKNKIKSLNNSNIRSFITETSHIASGKDETVSQKTLHSYLDKHLAKNVRFVSKITYHLPDMPEQETSIVLNKGEFIDKAGEGAQSVQSYDNQVEVANIKILSGKRKAFVNTINTETGFMTVPNPDTGGSEDVPIEGKSECTQSVILDDGIIQISNAVCTTNIHFLE